MLKVIELFAGVGSQTQALKELGVEHEVTAISEVDKFAVQSYTALHGAPNNLGDITKIGKLPAADLWIYSFPCQSISLAGKQEGLTKGGGTRSGLLWEVERLLVAAKDNGTLPKYLLLENVKALAGKKFKGDFDTWLSFLSSLGYANYWRVLNTKDYAIPQNRERVFAVSIRGAHTPYKFPEKRELRLRLKNMLDAEVEEKFYLSERALKSLGNSTFNQERGRLQDADGIHRTCLCRDYKSPSCVKVGDLSGGKWDKAQKHMRRVYSPEGVSPTVHTCGGGNTELKIIDDTYKGREPREYAECSPTIRGKSYDFKVAAGQIQPANRDYKADGEPRKARFELRGDGVANAVLTGECKNMVQIVASRGRNPDNPSDRTAGSPTAQRLEPNEKGLCNALTSVQKDNLVLEASYITDADASVSKCVRASGHGAHFGHTWDVIRIREATKKGYAEAAAGDGVNIQYLNSTTARARVGKGVSNTLMCNDGRGVVTEDIRIRKLTPWECWRLQGWRDGDINKVRAAGVSNAQQYKQAGNGITVTVLIALFGELFGAPYDDILNNWSWREKE